MGNAMKNWDIQQEITIVLQLFGPERVMKTEKKLESLYKTQNLKQSRGLDENIAIHENASLSNIETNDFRCFTPNFLKLKTGLILLQKEHPYVPTSNF